MIFDSGHCFDDTPSSIKLAFNGGLLITTAGILWDAFRRTNFMFHLEKEVQFLERKDAWGDSGFSRHNIKDLLDMPGAETKIFGVEKWAILLVLFRSRTIPWRALQKRSRFETYERLGSVAPYSITAEDVENIEKVIKRIRHLLRVDDGKDNIDRQSGLKSLPDQFQLEEGIDFLLDREIIVGYGGNATVYGARYPINSDKINAAFKEIRMKPGVALTDQFTEIHYMLMVKHEHIMAIHGWAQISQNTIGLIMPRRDYNLGDVLCNPLTHFSGSYLIDDPTKYIKIALAIAKGIQELHRVDTEPDDDNSFKPEILHRDIKPANILISGCFETIEISDFGSSKANRVQSTANSPHRCTIDYEAPELKTPDAVYTKACDIWSYGVILAQMVYRMEMERPMQVYEVLNKLHSKEWGHPLRWPIIKSATLNLIAARIIALAERCLDITPSKRVTAGECVSKLQYLGDWSSVQRSDSGRLGRVRR